MGPFFFLPLLLLSLERKEKNEGEERFVHSSAKKKQKKRKALVFSLSFLLSDKKTQPCSVGAWPRSAGACLPRRAASLRRR